MTETRLKRFALSWLICGGVVGTLAASALEREQPHHRAPRIDLRPCSPSVAGNGLCGTYQVYENRQRKTGRTIGLNIVVVPALGPAHAPDPVFWLEGGPGGAATQAIGPVAQNYLRGVRDERDLVFVDQRGTGKSNPLKCEDIGESASNLDAYFGPLFPPALIRSCRETLERVADLRLYTTSIAMDDLDDVRDALGYDRINIAAASYGTLAAQLYMHQHPEHVRAAFLVGLVTPDFKLPLPFARAAQNALDHLFADCAVEQDCHGAFPDLPREFDAVLARFAPGPLRVTVLDPATQQPRSILLHRENYVEHLRALLYSTGTARFVPLIVHRAFLGDFVPFGTMTTRVNLGGPNTSRGLYFSVTCAEAIPFITEEEIEKETRDTFLGDRRVRAHISACNEWPRGSVGRDFTAPLKSDAPAVIFSGDADGSTPPWIADAAASLFPNGREIRAPHTGHQIDGPCTWNLMEAFIKAGSVDHLDTACVEHFRRPPVATELPAPWRASR